MIASEIEVRTDELGASPRLARHRSPCDLRRRVGRATSFRARRSDQCVGTNGRDFARLQRLIDELEGNRPDQEAGTQRHHDRDELLARRHRVRDEPSDEEGGGSERTPEEGLDHGWRLTGRRDGTREVVLRERSGPWSRLTQR
jgi:hypothetical protein